MLKSKEVFVTKTGTVCYWSQHFQTYKAVRYQNQVAAQDWPALPQESRSLLSKLPENWAEETELEKLRSTK